MLSSGLLVLSVFTGMRHLTERLRGGFSKLELFIRRIVYSSFKRRLIKLSGEGLWIATGQVAVVIGGLMSVRVLTGYLSPLQYGQLALATTIAALANQTLMGGLANAFARYYSIASEQGDLKAYVSDGIKLVAVAAGIVLGAGLLSCGLLIASNYSSWGIPILLIIPLAILNGCNVCLNSFQNAARHRVVVSLHGGMEVWLKIAFAILAVSIMGPTLAAVLTGFVFASAAVLASQLGFLKHALDSPLSMLIGRSTKSRWIKPMLAFAWPFSAWGGFTWAQQSSDRWSLATFANVSSVGQYNVAYQLGYAPITILTNFCVTLAGPVLFMRVGSGADQQRAAHVKKSIWILAGFAFALTIVGFLAALVFHDALFRILVAEAYRDSSIYFPWLVLGGGLFAVGQMVTIQHLSELRPGQLLPIKIGTALIGVMLAFAGSYLAGTWGVVSATVIFGLIYMLTVLRSALSKAPSVQQSRQDITP